MKKFLVIRHLLFEDLGLIADVLSEHDIQPVYKEAGVDDLSDIDLTHYEGLIILGGPIGAYETDAYPFLEDEITLIRQQLDAKRPLLGICLGAQLIAVALGAKVYPGPEKEIGWAPLHLTPSGQQSALGALGNHPVVLHWHGDILDLPPGADCLASTAATPNQAFRIGDYCLGLQFHLEVLGADIERWLIGHALEIAKTDGVSVEQIRRDTKTHAEALLPSGRRVIEDWLLGLGL